MGIFWRREAAPAASEPGTALVALRVNGGSVPPGCAAVVAGRDGATRRLGAGSRVAAGHGETAWCFHPGPYQIELAPFAAAPEAGLRLAFVIDTPDPRVAQQRFDLFLASEAAERVGVAELGSAIENALQRELAQGNLDLPPCVTLAEWDVFRAGLDELLYTRFGVTVEECMPADLGDARDYARMLAQRAPAQAPAALMRAASQPKLHTDPDPDPATLDARALRRLFLELPRVASCLRLSELPAGAGLFRQHQALVQRLDQVSLCVATMPALELAAPGRRLDRREQQRRARHSVRAAQALDEAWALLARLKDTGHAASLLDDADRIVANLEHDSAGRRALAARDLP